MDSFYFVHIHEKIMEMNNYATFNNYNVLIVEMLFKFHRPTIFEFIGHSSLHNLICIKYLGLESPPFEGVDDSVANIRYHNNI